MTVSNLPPQPTPFIGREHELADIARLLADPACRLLTIVGPGGMGKTRLALEAAQRATPRNGSQFVALQPLTSPNSIVHAIADALGIQFFQADDPKQQLLNCLQNLSILLIMDNFEHLLDGVSLLSEILVTSPSVRILVTSRERLNLHEEWTYTLDGLSFPEAVGADALETYSAVLLFVQRARQVRSDFTLKGNNEAIVTICQQLEGMPLGIELAAGWLRAMSCAQVAARIQSDLNFLTSPTRNLPERHRSLSNVFEQSWNMLTVSEQGVLMRLSVFRGGFDLEAAEQVADAELPILAAMVDKSLIRLDGSGRYDLHEMLRQFAAEKLLGAGEMESTAHRHLGYFEQLAVHGEVHSFGREQIAWFDRLEIELNNIRAALEWSLHSGESQTGMQLAAALGWFFSERSHEEEGLEWLEHLIVAAPDAPASLRSKAFHNAGWLAGISKDDAYIRTLCEQALSLAKAANDPLNIAWSLCRLGFQKHFDLDWEATTLEDSLSLFRRLEDPFGLSHVLISRTFIAYWQKDYAYGKTLVNEVSVIAMEFGDEITIGWVAYLHGLILWRPTGDFVKARDYLEQSLIHFRKAQTMIGITQTLLILALVERAVGNDQHAQAFYTEVLILLRQSTFSVDFILAGLANVARRSGQFVRAVTLLAAAANRYIVIDSNLPLLDVIEFQDDVGAMRTQLDTVTFAQAWARGKAMTREESIDYALESDATPVKTTTSVLLTARELAILRLITQGLNSREIADKLVLGVSTVRWYLKQIYSKLDVHSRSEALARARELNLLP